MIKTTRRSRGQTSPVSISSAERVKRGRKPKVFVEHPTPLTDQWIEPPSFGAALTLHVYRHGVTLAHLHRAVIRPGERFDRKIFYNWADDIKLPGTTFSLAGLERIEHRYRLPSGYFRDKLPERAKAPRGRNLPGLTPAQRRRIAWHLPDDLDALPAKKRAEIVEWVERVIVSGATDYRRFLAEAMQSRYALRFPGSVRDDWKSANGTPHSDTRDAPPRLVAEITALIQFKTKARHPLPRPGVSGQQCRLLCARHHLDRSDPLAALV